MYYYYVVFARALEASGLEMVPRNDRSGDRSHQDRSHQSQGHDWRADLVERLATLQNEDGSFRSVDDRWMENDPVLITAYALIALRHAAGDARGPERGTPAP
jgi:squalene-hopene/tetraprenyl-beta-curcumene cyclase